MFCLFLLLQCFRALYSSGIQCGFAQQQSTFQHEISLTTGSKESSIWEEEENSKKSKRNFTQLMFYLYLCALKRVVINEDIFTPRLLSMLDTVGAWAVLQTALSLIPS